MAETFTLYKLIVLYMLDRVDFPLTTSQISEFILDKGYTTYFRLQSALAELTDSGLLKIELTHNRTLYNLTEEGAATINYFRNKISPEIRQEIDNFINEKKYDLKEEVSVKSDYYLNTNHEYEVKCQILENGSHLIDMTLTVPTQTEAEAIVNNWNRKNQEIYALLLSQLLLTLLDLFLITKVAGFIEPGVFYFIRKILLIHIMIWIIMCVLISYSVS